MVLSISKSDTKMTTMIIKIIRMGWYRVNKNVINAPNSNYYKCDYMGSKNIMVAIGIFEEKPEKPG